MSHRCPMEAGLMPWRDAGPEGAGYRNVEPAAAAHRHRSRDHTDAQAPLGAATGKAVIRNAVCRRNWVFPNSPRWNRVFVPPELPKTSQLFSLPLNKADINIEPVSRQTARGMLE